MLLTALLSGFASLASAALGLEVCEAPCTLIGLNAEDGTYNVTMIGEGIRSTPLIAAEIITGAHADIDGDGVEDFLIVDGRDTAAGHGVAVVYDLSVGEPFAFWACAFQLPDADLAIETCRLDYEGTTLERSLSGLQYLHDATRQDGVTDWETQHLAIPNLTSQIAYALTRQNVELARRDLSLAITLGSDTAAAEVALHAALLLREQHANLHPTGE